MTEICPECNTKIQLLDTFREYQAIGVSTTYRVYECTNCKDTYTKEGNTVNKYQQ